MRVIVNGNEEQTEARTLDGLLRELGYGTAKVATALNGQFVPAAERSNVQLDSGAKIEIVSPRQGG
ncbi:MAG: sulfur carrier protein ThiS [Pseudomonadota bacterium]